MTCECKAIRNNGEMKIIFCPLHAAAQAMLYMLQHIEIHGLRNTGFADLKDLIDKAGGRHE